MRAYFTTLFSPRASDFIASVMFSSGTTCRANHHRGKEAQKRLFRRLLLQSQFHIPYNSAPGHDTQPSENYITNVKSKVENWFRQTCFSEEKKIGSSRKPSYFFAIHEKQAFHCRNFYILQGWEKVKDINFLPLFLFFCGKREILFLKSILDLKSSLSCRCQPFWHFFASEKSWRIFLQEEKLFSHFWAFMSTGRSR